MSAQQVEAPGYYAIIPANVRYSKIPDGAKLLYGEITSLCNKKGHCWATNGYFARLYGKSPRTISGWIGSLKDNNFIFTEANEAKGNQRKIYLSLAPPLPVKIRTPPLAKNV